MAICKIFLTLLTVRRTSRIPLTYSTMTKENLVLCCSCKSSLGLCFFLQLNLCRNYWSVCSFFCLMGPSVIFLLYHKIRNNVVRNVRDCLIRILSGGLRWSSWFLLIYMMTLHKKIPSKTVMICMLYTVMWLHFGIKIFPPQRKSPFFSFKSFCF